jgi:acyl-CoA reductase-like NAD-dependent aldehyde dehydrogenase
MVRALMDAGLPAGCLNFLPTQPSDAPLVTELAVKHPLVRRVNFTGSDRVGIIIAGWAASVLKQCVFELGGKAPVLVLEDANIKDAVEAIIYGALSNSGQICMSTERVIVHESVAEEFKTALLAKAKSVKCGNHYDEPDVVLSGLYTPASAKRILGLVKSAIAEGAELLTGDLTIRGPNGTILSPHILDKVTMNMAISNEETFGPIIYLYQVSSDNEAIEVANSSEFTLCASVYSRDVMRAMGVAKRVRAGSVHVNGPTVYIEATLPNGGTGGRSGYGRFGGMAGVEEFTERKILSLAQSGMTFPF